MNGNYYRESEACCCYFHPKEVLVGVCPLCLNDRLLVLAAKQGLSPHQVYNTKRRTHSFNNNHNHNINTSSNSKPSLYNSLPNKIFALGSLLHRRASRRHRKSDRDDHLFDVATDDPDTSSSSLEDESFISIKFGDNGVASWDKSNNTVSKVSLEHCSSLSWGGQTSVKDATKRSDSNNSKGNNKSVVEHAKPRDVSLRWRKRIGQLLHIIRWKRSSNAKGGGGGGNSKVEGVKMVRSNKGWIRTLKIRTRE